MKACGRLGNVKTLLNSKVLILGDNLAVTLAFSRRRAKDYKPLSQLRRLVAVGLCRGLRFYFRWIPNELNVAHGDSRCFEPAAPSRPRFTNNLVESSIASESKLVHSGPDPSTAHQTNFGSSREATNEDASSVVPVFFEEALDDHPSVVTARSNAAASSTADSAEVLQQRST